MDSSTCIAFRMQNSPPVEILPSTHGAAKAPTVHWHLHADAFVFAVLATNHSQEMQGCQGSQAAI